MSLLLNTRGKRGGRQFLNRLFGRFKKNTVLPSDVNALAQWIQSYMQNKSARSCLRNLHWWIWKRGNESQTVKSIQWVIFDFTMRNIIIYFLQRFKKNHWASVIRNSKYRFDNMFGNSIIFCRNKIPAVFNHGVI